MDRQVIALSLFSGGLDSILASRLVASQGIRVLGVKFVSPFFDYQILSDVAGYRARMFELYGVDVVVEDISEAYLRLLHKPDHGFGKNFNPCIDCKVLMVGLAREMMERYGASFLISGEVLGQRPMSQRRDTLNVIERDSGARDLLLRPLSARLLKPTLAEEEGLVDRERLLNFSGRGRSRQMELAAEYGITEFPAPGGGCRLTDPILSRRIAMVYRDEFVLPSKALTPQDMHCLMTGRQFLLPGGGWLALGRDQLDNLELTRLYGQGDILLRTQGHPGPTALLRRAEDIYSDEGTKEDDVALAAALVVRYAKKVEGEHRKQQVLICQGERDELRQVQPVQGEIHLDWML